MRKIYSDMDMYMDMENPKSRSNCFNSGIDMFNDMGSTALAFLLLASPSLNP